VGFEISVAGNAYNPMSSIVTVQTEADVLIEIRHEMGTTPAQGPGEIYVQGLAAGRTHTLSVFADDEFVSDVEVKIEALSNDWTQCTPTVPVEPTQEIVCTSGSDGDGSIYFCVDRQGTPVWSMAHPDGEGLSVVTPLEDGRFVAVSWTKAALSVFSERGQLIAEYTPSWFEQRTRYQHDWIDMHEVFVLEEGPWKGALAFMTKTRDVVGEEVLYAGGIIVFDLDGEQVLWDWQLHGVLGDEQPITSLLSYDRFGLSTDDATDWDHSNALLHRVRDDGGDEFWVSLRNQDWIIAVDAETDDVLWRLGFEGDFDADVEDWFFQQHAPELHVVDGVTRLFVYDNSVARADGGARVSRVLELELDEVSMTASVVAQLGGFFAPNSGDVDLADDGESLIYVVGTLPSPTIVEVAWPNGELLWELGCDTTMYRVESSDSIYDRARRTD
jgi:hypothetical protein